MPQKQQLKPAIPKMASGLYSNALIIAERSSMHSSISQKSFSKWENPGLHLLATEET